MNTNKNSTIQSLQTGDHIEIMEGDVGMFGRIMLIDYNTELVVLSDEFGPQQFDLSQSQWVKATMH